MNIIYIHTHDMGIYNQAYGFNIPTPNLLNFAKEGTLFRRNYCANPTCSASRAAMLTGQTPHQCGMTGLAHRGFKINDYDKHMANFLKQNDYETVLCGVQHEINAEGKFWENLGYQKYLKGKEDVKSFNGYVNSDIKNAEAVVDYLNNRKKDKPLYLAFGMSVTHRKFIKSDMGIDSDYVSVPHTMYDNPETRKDFAEYSASAKVLDYCAGMVFDALKKNGYEKDSFIFFTTDHGIAFPKMKCNLYDSGIRVSLMIKHPENRLKGKAVDSLTSHLDIFPTVCDCAGLKKPERLTGKSLIPLLKKQSDKVRDDIYAEINYHAAFEPSRCVRTKRYKYIKYYGEYPFINGANCDDGYSKSFMVNKADWLNRPHLTEGLFDMYLDPTESVNLKDSLKHQNILKDMKERLKKHMVDTNDPLLNGEILKPKDAIADKEHQVSPGFETKVSLVAAMAKNYVIGKDDKIPWRIPGEQKRFKDLTIGNTVIMGRKTYESIGKPLPKRKTIVISKTKKIEEENCVTVTSLYDALLMVKGEKEVFIAGGGRVYKESLRLADKIYLTVIDREYQGNVFFPKFNEDLFEMTYKKKIDGEIPYVYYTYERKESGILK